jgi:lipopolysaccharide export system ATP-binding protein
MMEYQARRAQRFTAQVEPRDFYAARPGLLEKPNIKRLLKGGNPAFCFSKTLLHFIQVPKTFILGSYHMKKAFLKIKYACIIAAFSIFCIQTAITSASEKSFFSQTRDVAQQFISDYDFVLSPLSDTFGGFALCGYPCAGVGLGLGIIDEALIHYGYFDQRYLSWGLLSGATGNLIVPKPELGAFGLIESSVGIVAGVLLTSETMEPVRKLIPPFIAPAIAGVAAGAAFNKNPIAIAGGAGLGALDEGLMHYSYTDRHYLTTLTLGKWLTDKMLPPKIANFVLAGLVPVLASIKPNWEQELKNTVIIPMTMASKLNTNYQKLISPDQLRAHFDKQKITLFGSQIMSQLVSRKISSMWNPIMQNYQQLNSGNVANWVGVRDGVMYFGIFLFPVLLADTVTGAVNNHFDEKLYHELLDRMQSEIYTGENAVRFAHHENYTKLTDDLEDTVSSMVYGGNALVTQSASTAIHGAYGLGMVIVYSPNIATYNLLYNSAKNYISIQMASQKGKYNAKNREISSDLSTLKKDLKANINTIAEREGLNITHERIANLSEQLRENTGSLKIWGMLDGVWKMTTGYANSILDYLFIARGIQQGQIPFDQRGQVMAAGGQLSSLFSLPGSLAEQVENINHATERFIVIEGIIHAKTESLDQIERIYEGDKYLKMNNLEVGNEEKGLLVKIDDLKLEMGKIYAVTGPKGTGKSCLMSKIKGIKDNGLWGRGLISYPKIKEKNANIVMIGKDYVPLKQTLQDIIAYPDKPPRDLAEKSKQREEIIQLFKETGLESFISQIDDTKDWAQTLSGGEMKTMLLISALYHKPDVLILDEIFSRLDPTSVKTVQKLLKDILTKYLPNTLTLIIDHYADKNNYDNFYNYRLHIENQKATLGTFGWFESWFV